MQDETSLLIDAVFKQMELSARYEALLAKYRKRNIHMLQAIQDELYSECHPSDFELSDLAAHEKDPDATWPSGVQAARRVVGEWSHGKKISWKEALNEVRQTKELIQ